MFYNNVSVSKDEINIVITHFGKTIYYGSIFRARLLDLVKIYASCSKFSVVGFSYRVYKISEIFDATLTNLQSKPTCTLV